MCLQIDKKYTREYKRKHHGETIEVIKGLRIYKSIEDYKSYNSYRLVGPYQKNFTYQKGINAAYIPFYFPLEYLFGDIYHGLHVFFSMTGFDGYFSSFDGKVHAIKFSAHVNDLIGISKYKDTAVFKKLYLDDKECERIYTLQGQ